jgi:zinc and cadmium transporter
MDQPRVRKLATSFVSFAVDALLGDAFIQLIPKAFPDPVPNSASLGPSLLILGGLRPSSQSKNFCSHNHGILDEHCHGHPSVTRLELAAINILGDTIQNFIDGIIFGASYLASPTLGLLTTIAVLLHEIPQELAGL